VRSLSGCCHHYSQAASPLEVIWELWFSLSALKTTYTSFKTQEKTVQKMGLKNTTSAKHPAPVQGA
jgi:hypothetical protein